MKLRFRFLWRLVLIFFLSAGLHFQGWSQPGDDQDGDQDESGLPGGSTTDLGNPGQDPDLPIDSNVFILVVAGVGYGLKKIYDMKKKKVTSQNMIVR